LRGKYYFYFCLWFRASLIYINNCPADATQSSLFIILQVHSTCSGCQQHQSSGVHKTVTTAKLAWPCWREVAAQKIWPVLEAVVTVLCTHDDGRDWHPKHIEWTCRIINRLLYVVSRWTIINILHFLFKIFILPSILPPIALLTTRSYVPEPNNHSFHYLELRIVGVTFRLVQGGSQSSLAQLQPRYGSQDTPLGIVTKLRSGRPSNRVSISDRARDSPPPPKVTARLWPLPDAYSVGTGRSFPTG